MNNFARIPEELKNTPNWIVWRQEHVQGAPKPTKVPYDALKRSLASRQSHASSVDPRTWSSFDEALAALDSHLFSGLGFCFGPEDPYCGIDLDYTNGDQLAYERQVQIHNHFDTYSEISPSGRGVHMIVKASVPAGRKRAFIEIYSSGRFFTMTGNVWNDKPIQDRQEYTQALWEELDTSSASLVVKPGDPIQRQSDRAVYDRCIASANGQKFYKLWQGDWRNVVNERTGIPYSSQSEADQALINIIAYHTQNRDQIHNMFLQSGLGQREKARRVDYVQRNITKAFDQIVPTIDLEAAKNNILAKLAAEKEAAHAQPSVTTGAQAAIAAAMAANPSLHMNGAAVNLPPTGIIQPPGLLGEIAGYMYVNASRRVPEIALMGALGFMAGVCGRAFNISATGLNQYFLLLAETGRGKDAMSQGIDMIIDEFRQDLPAADKFRGPARLESGQALIKLISENHSFVSVMSEFDKFLQNLTSIRASGPTVLLKGLLLELYMKSGQGAVYAGAAYSDKQKTIKPVKSPAFSLLGECTPEKFFELLSSDLVREGFLPRFLMIEYTGIRVEQNNTRTPLDKSTRKRLEALMFQAISMNNKDQAMPVALDADTDRMSIAYGRHIDDQINKTKGDAIAELWNRAHLKVLKLAGLVAVGNNPFQPVVTPEVFMWAVNLVERDVQGMLARFEQGAIGSDDSRQLADAKKAIREYIERPFDALRGYQINRQLHEAKVIPYVYLQRKLHNLSSFNNDKRMSPTAAIQKTLSTLMATGNLVQVNPDQAGVAFGSGARGKCYQILEVD